MVDLWAMGVLLYYIASNQEFPFEYNQKCMVKTDYHNLIIKQAVKDNFSAEYIDLFTSLLTVDPAQRLGSKGGIQEVLNHIVFTKNSILTAEEVAKIFKPDLIDSNQDFYDIKHRKEV